MIPIEEVTKDQLNSVIDAEFKIWESSLPAYDERVKEALKSAYSAGYKQRHKIKYAGRFSV